MTTEQLREQILQLVTEYAKQRHAPRPFVPGETVIPPAGKVFGAEEVCNAVDASLITGGAVEVGWAKIGPSVEVWVDDEGPGISNASNLFVPFFTTKPHGSGIGLVLSRQIAESHQGVLILENRANGGGCRALLRIPV